MAFRLPTPSHLQIGAKRKTYESNVFYHKLDHLRKFVSKLDERSEEYFTDVSRLFGEDTHHFQSLDELDNFLTILDIEEEGQSYSLDEKTKDDLRKLKVAVDKYKEWKVTVAFDKEVLSKDVHTKVSLLYTLSADQVIQISDAIAVSSGFTQIRDIVKAIVRSMIEELNHDKDVKRRQREIVLVLLKIMLNVVNAGILAEIVQKGIDASLEGENSLILAALAGETLKTTVLESSTELVQTLSNLFDQQITAESIEALIDHIWNLSIKFMNKNIDLNNKLRKTLTDVELETEINHVRMGKELRDDLYQRPSPQRFDYNTYVAEKIATKMKQENDALVKALCSTMTEAEREAKLIVTLEGEKNRQKLRRDVIRYYNSVTLCRAYFRKESQEQCYHDAKHPSTFTKFKMMINAAKQTKYFPANINNNALMLLDAPATKGMHVGGRNIRKYVYDHLPDLKNPVYGYGKDGRYTDKNRIRDTWRADQIIQVLLIKNQASTNPHDFLPFLSFKASDDIGKGILDLLRINPFFTPLHSYKFAHLPQPTPLYLFMQMDDYRELLDRPAVKKYLKDNIDSNLILLSITNPNINSPEDHSRLMQALNDTFSLLKKIDFKSEQEQEIIYSECKKYIDLQCSMKEKQTRIKKIEELIYSHNPFKPFYDKDKHMEQLQQSLKKCQEKLVHLIEHVEILRKDTKNNERIALVEKMIVSYLLSDLSPRHLNPSIQEKLHEILPALLENKEFPVEKVKEHLKDYPDDKLHSQKIYAAVLEHHQLSADVNKLATFQNKICHDPDIKKISPGSIETYHEEKSTEKTTDSFEDNSPGKPVLSDSLQKSISSAGLVAFGKFSPPKSVTSCTHIPTLIEGEELRKSFC